MFYGEIFEQGGHDQNCTLQKLNWQPCIKGIKIRKAIMSILSDLRNDEGLILDKDQGKWTGE